MSADNRLFIHHIGGRNGHGSFNIPPAFAKDFVSVNYEADDSAVDQITAVQVSSGNESYVLPYCLAGSNGVGKLYMNYDPYTSSLLRSRHMDRSYVEFVGYDYVFSEAMKTMEERSVILRRFDDVMELRDPRIDLPDILTLDTQGSELEILEGAEASLKARTLAIICEVEFVELYKGQKLFGDACKTLDALGFEFCGFDYISQPEHSREPLGMRGNGYMTAADAIFFKKLELFNDDVAALRKMAVIAHLLRQHALGFECLRLCRSIEHDPNEVGDTVYSGFLDELQLAVEAMPKLLPWKFSELWSFEASVMRFDESKRDAYNNEHEKRRREYGEYLRAHQEIVLMLLRDPETPIESVFRRFGLAGHAEAIRQRRVKQAQECCRVGNLSYSYGDGVLRVWK